MKRYTKTLLLLFLPILQGAQFDEKSKDFETYAGFFDFMYDDDSDKIYLQVDDLETEFLYVYSLSSGVGSNDIGLDRGQLGEEQVVFFRDDWRKEKE